MSYCQFSSDGWRCDVHVYKGDDGFVTKVAGNRVTRYVPAERAAEPFCTFFESTPIWLPHAGETFSDATAGACADRLEMLRGLGYHVPQSAIDTLREEAAQAPE